MPPAPVLRSPGPVILLSPRLSAPSTDMESRVRLLAVPSVRLPEARTTATPLLTIQLFGVPPPSPLWPRTPEFVMNCRLDVLVKMKLFAEPAPLLRLSRFAPGLMTRFPPIVKFRVVLGVLLPLDVTNPPSITTSPPTCRSFTAVVDKKRTEAEALLEPCIRSSCRTVVRRLLKLTAPEAVRFQ